ncbi:MAG: helix-turn-helix domain-containing protein [Candidatus Hydrogenedentes bacterium]|nr:helix-turn-helix domain-containing protein [Candidatus Hydrogenedentota bacterium]
MSKAFPGQLLRARREKLGLTLAQVHEHIHVPVEYIRAMEEGALDHLPTFTYSAGFLNSYCQLLDLAPEPFLDQFRAATHRRQHAVAPREHTVSSIMDRVPQPAWMTEFIAWGTICAIIVLGWITYATIVRPFAQNAEQRLEAGPVGIQIKHFEEETGDGEY